MSNIGFGVLGPLQVTVDRAPVPLGTPKQRAVLAVLVMNRNRPVGIDSLITAAWEQWPPRKRGHACTPTSRTCAGCLATRGRWPDGACVTGTDPAPRTPRREESRQDHCSAHLPQHRPAHLGQSVVGAGEFARDIGTGLSTAGRRHPDRRLSDNDIVLDDANVSRHHAVIIDTGTSFVITDLRSANGVDVGNERIRATATLVDGDRIHICDHEFTFEIAPRET